MSLVIERYLMGVKPTGGIIISRQYHLVKIPPLSTLPAVAGDQRISKHHLLRHVWGSSWFQQSSLLIRWLMCGECLSI